MAKVCHYIFRQLLKDLLLRGEKEVENSGKSITLRYMTPHQKWGIHTMFTDTTNMIQLFRGWQVVWMNEEDAASIGIKDNDWIEVYNRNGAVVARAVTNVPDAAGSRLYAPCTGSNYGGSGKYH